MKEKKILLWVLVLFLLTNLVVLALRQQLSNYHFDITFVLAANALLFVVVSLSVLIQLRTLHSVNTHAFIRGVNSGMLIKMFVCLVAIFIYIYSKSGKVNQPGLFTSMALYIAYTVVEVKGLMAAARKRNA